MIKIFAVNPFREATYIVSDSSKECVIIDCGAVEDFEFERIAQYIQDNQLKPVMALNTHAHIDHILGVDKICKMYNIPFALSSLDTPTLDNAYRSAEMFGIPTGNFTPPTIDIDLKDMDKITFGDTTLTVIHTPGHCSGGVCFYDEKEKVLFSGDSVFQGSIGRTDLPTGDYDKLMDSITKKILPLGKDEDVDIYPGHGNHTSISKEITTNPFITEYLSDSINNPENLK